MCYPIISWKEQTLKDSSLGGQNLIVNSLVFIFHIVMPTRLSE